MYKAYKINKMMMLMMMIHPSIHPSMCLLAENVHTKITVLKMTMLNGIPNRRGRPFVKTLVFYNTKHKHRYI